jgi:hypothetical protein
MDVKTQERLQVLLDKAVNYVCLVAGTSYEEGIAAIRPYFQDAKTSPAAWLYKFVRWMYPTKEPDSVRPELFYEILGLIDTREKFNAVFASLPEHETPELERVLNIFLKKVLPGIRFVAWQLTKILPQRRGGGRPPKIPSPEDCRKICNEISEAHRPLMTAQKQAAQRWRLKLRMIQTIWADHDLYPAQKDSGSTESDQ